MGGTEGGGSVDWRDHCTAYRDPAKQTEQILSIANPTTAVTEEGPSSGVMDIAMNWNVRA